MCQYFEQIKEAMDNYKQKMFNPKGQEIFDEMTMETKIDFMQKHPSH